MKPLLSQLFEARDPQLGDEDEGQASSEQTIEANVSLDADIALSNEAEVAWQDADGENHGWSNRQDLAVDADLDASASHSRDDTDLDLG